MPRKELLRLSRINSGRVRYHKFTLSYLESWRLFIHETTVPIIPVPCRPLPCPNLNVNFRHNILHEVLVKGAYLVYSKMECARMSL